MTRMTGPDCVVMCNLINTYIHTYIHTYTAFTFFFKHISAMMYRHIENPIQSLVHFLSALVNFQPRKGT